MRNWIRSLSILALAAFCTAVRATAQEAASSAPAATPRVEVSSKQWDFEQTWQGEAISNSITVRNVGDAPLEIVDVKSSCGCTVPTKPRSPLLPGESDVMTISYDTKKRVGPAHQTITLTTNDPQQRDTLITVTGTVLALYEMDPKEGLVFGQLLESSQASRSAEITNKYISKMSLQIKEGQDFGPFAVELKELEPGLRYSLVATTKPPLAPGRFQASVVLRTGLERIPEISTVVYGFVRQPVDVRPAKLFLPRNSLQEMKRTIWVSHAPDRPLEIVGVKASHETIKVELLPAAQPALDGSGMAEYQIQVLLPPGDRIPVGAEPAVEITTNSKDPAYQKLVVPIQVIEPPRGPGGTGQPSPAGQLGTPDAPATRPAPATQPTVR